MSNFIRMKANASGHVNITLDLSLYIETYEKAYGVSRPVGPEQDDAITQFERLTIEMYGQLEGVLGQIHWIDALDLATQNLEQSQKDDIAQSPAARMMDNSFIEIIKNSMDECVSRYYDSNHSVKPMMQLGLDVDNTSNPDQVLIQITDAGRGFPDSFLSKVNTQQNRDTYVNTSRGSQKQKQMDRPPLFGGQGRGLRILIAAEDGDVLERSGKRIHRFTKPEVSSIEFDNIIDTSGHVQGAQITVTTSIEPQEELVWKASKIKEQLHADMRVNATPSPSGSEATTNESPSSSRSSPPMLDLGLLDDEGEDEDENNRFSP
jgi:hypothetical protein